MNYSNDVDAAKALHEKYQAFRSEISKVIVGQDDVIDKVFISIMSKGHALLIGVPGLAKTLLVTTISRALGLSFNRIQFTPDLMPSDIVGTEVLDETRHFRFLKGPVFANIILADEINRTPPKTQSALLEAMQEKTITVAGKTYTLPDPFFVLATQNPIEQEGTYPLPEAQLDRFMFSIWLDYPSVQEEIEIVKRTTVETLPMASEMMKIEDILFMQNLVRRVPVNDNIYQYAVRLASITRPGHADSHKAANDYIAWGAGPRASQFMILGAKCHALLKGKYSPDIEDVIAIAPSVLRHRIVKNYKAEAEGVSMKELINKLMQ